MNATNNESATELASTVPTPLDQRLFRRVMGHFATGVTVITTTVDDEIYGMTANAFMAGSLEPMLCVVSINRTAQMHQRLTASGHYGVSFLSQHQQHLSGHFAGHRHVSVSVAPEFVYRGKTPIVHRAVAAVTADIVDVAACGDHTLFIGKITHLEAASHQPLLFYAGRYATIESQDPIEESERLEFW